MSKSEFTEEERKEREREYDRKRNKDPKRKQQTKDRQTSPSGRYAPTKRSAKKRDILFCLTKEEYISLASQPCWYCNYALGTPVAYRGGLDRLDSNQGYTIENCVSCCFVCNTIKNERFTPEETKAAVQAVIAYRKSKI
jgi:hypothetical protein